MSNANKIDWYAVNELLRESEQKLADVLSPNPDRIRRIQAERAARLVSRRKTVDVEKTVPMLLVEVAGERIAIEVTTASELMPLSGLAPVPGAPDGTLGVINLRGEIYCVLDTRRYLKSERDGGDVTWGIALRHPVLRVMLGVHAVMRIENVPVSALMSAEDRVLKVQDEIAIILDARGILEGLETGLASVINSLDQQ